MKQHVAKVAATCFYHLRRLRQIRRRVGAEVKHNLCLHSSHLGSTIATLSWLVFRRTHSSHYNGSRTPQCGWSFNWDCVSMSHQDSSSCTGCLRVGAFNTNYVQWCNRCTWRNAQSTWTTLMRQFASSSSRSGLQPSTSNTYVTPRLCTKFGERAFSHAGPTAWNSLSVNIRAETSQIKFKKLLKTHFLISLFAVDCVFCFRDTSFTLFYVL